jgi:SAM-dependent methyltransferase
MIDLPSIADDLLLRQMMISGRVADAELERVLTLARGALLAWARGAYDPGETVQDFFCALAQQYFLTEYVFCETNEERAVVERLCALLGERLAAGGDVRLRWLVAVAAFRPLHRIAGAEALLRRDWPEPVERLLTLQLREPLEEQAIRAALPVLTAIDDPVSRAVQAQYEDNPYPRWVTAPPAVKAFKIGDYIREKFPRASILPVGNADGVDILIAGCGTGSHPIETYRKLAGARMLAIDLSSTSLAYAVRKTRALGLPIEYAQADILALDGLGRSFDVIEASGSLHHLRDPAAGWRALLRLLRPGGLMLLGLYSRQGRADINAARAIVVERGYRGTIDDIRRFRRDAFVWPDDRPGKSVTRLGDFYSASGCRDLLFHVQEYQHDLPEIAAFIAAEELQFLGFDLDVRVLQAYAVENPDDPAMIDLERWHRFECANPGIFSAMYQFWVQKA